MTFATISNNLRGHFSKINNSNILDFLTLAEIQKISLMLRPLLTTTPVVKSEWLGDGINANVFLKLENLQISGSFKARGVYAKFLSLTEEQRKNGVITISKGNHALSVASQAQHLGLKATIVMPENTLFSKVNAVRRYNPSIILQGRSIQESQDFALQLIKKHNYAMIHLSEDAYVIAGQGSVALELLKQVPDIDTLLVPMQGGALAAGICIAAKAINPNIHIIGVQAENCSGIAEVLFPNSLPNSTNFLNDGTLPYWWSPSQMALTILTSHLDDCLVIPKSYVDLAIEKLIDNNKIVAEPTGALGVAALLYKPSLFENKRVGTIVTGGNIDTGELAQILSYRHSQKGFLARYQIEAMQNTANFDQIFHIITKAGGEIFELTKQKIRVREETSKVITSRYNPTYIKATVEIRDAHHAQAVFQALNSRGFATRLAEGEGS